jgi:light-harvesting protein B-800-850 alpha chain
MIYGRIWTVVKPSVGIPLFLASVAIGAVFVHTALLLNTTWLKKYLNGAAATATAQADTASPVAAAPPTVQRQ